MIRTLQMQLNPPLVYALKQKFFGISFDSIRVTRANACLRESLRLGSKRGFRSQRTHGSLRTSRIATQINSTPRNLQPPRSTASRLSLASAHLLKGIERRDAIIELWHADTRMLLNVIHIAQRSLTPDPRRRALGLVAKVLKSRRVQWQLPLTRVLLRLPWLGTLTATPIARQCIRRYMQVLGGAYSGALPLFDPRSFIIRLVWVSPPSLGDIVSTAKRWVRKLDEDSWPCMCSHFDNTWLSKQKMITKYF